MRRNRNSDKALSGYMSADIPTTEQMENNMSSCR